MPRARAEGLELGHGLGEQVWGLALATMGSPDADAHIEAARQIYARTGQSIAGARLEVEWSRVLRQRGERAAGELAHARAVVVFNEAGAGNLIVPVE